MKKKLEADLISIAHRILKLKNKSDINQLYLETQKLYEKLAVLKFVDENFDSLKPTIGRTEVESELETIFEKEEIVPVEAKEETSIVAEEHIVGTDPEPEVEEEIEENPVVEIPEEIIEEPIAETVVEPIAETIEESVEEKIRKIEESISTKRKEYEAREESSFTTKSDLNPIPDFKPAFELEKEEEKITEEPKIETSKKSEPVHISFEDILGVNYADAQFVKVDSFEAVSPAPTPSISEFKDKEEIRETAILEPKEIKSATLNEKLAKGFHIDLNDRIAFTKNLFGNSSEDYSRVLNQLLTFNSYSEAQEFIENMVKPDYSNWEGKDDYAQRFLEIVEKKFS